MDHKGRIVVGYDGSVDSERGLAWAIDYARLRHLPVEAISSAGDIIYLPERTSHEAEQLAERWSAQAATRLQDAGLDDWKVSWSLGKVVPDLLEAARDAALVVVGAQGHGAVAGLLLGSVSQHLTRHAPCPVVVVRQPRNQRVRRVVVGVDGSPADQQTLRFAFDVAQRDSSTLVAIHAHDVSPVHGPWDADIPAEAAAEIEHARRLLAEVVAGHQEDHPDVAVELSPILLPAARALADASANASLVVVGSRGRGGFTGLLLGSVGAGVLHHAQCPVAIVR